MTHYTVRGFGSHAERDAGHHTYRACYELRADALADGDRLALPIVDVLACDCADTVGVRCAVPELAAR